MTKIIDLNENHFSVVESHKKDKSITLSVDTNFDMEVNLDEELMQQEKLLTSIKMEIDDVNENNEIFQNYVSKIVAFNNNIALDSLMPIKAKIKQEEDVTLDPLIYIEDKTPVTSNVQNGNYIGKILWGTFNQTNWFPCILYKMDENQVIVKYFNYNGLYASLSLKNIFEFDDMKQFWHEITAVRRINRSKIKSFSKVCLRAIEEAECFKTIPIADRIKVYDILIHLNTKHSDVNELENLIDELTQEKNVRQNLKNIIKNLHDFDRFEETKVVPKKEKKIFVKKENLTSRRSSLERVSKRKLEPEDKKSLSIDEFKSPVVKRIKVEAVKETLKERFYSKIDDIHILFADATKNKVCMKCRIMRQDDEVTFQCSGDRCAGWYHDSCFEDVELKQCFYCHSNQKKCQACDLIIESGKIIDCKESDCRLSYHENCLARLPENQRLCPQHYCRLCKAQGTAKDPLAKCLKCSSSYHTNIYCIPAGTIILSKTQIICPRHKTEKESKSKKKSLNIDWCSVCMGNGTIICCDGCPRSFHIECIPEKSQNSNEKFLCDDCAEGKLPVYNQIVWSKVGNYRWWPALIMLPYVVPLTTLKRQNIDREFCIRFFGTSNFIFTTSERVFPYESINEDLPTEKGGNRMDALYNMALLEALQMSKILDEESKEKREIKSKSFIKILQNRPVAPFKLKKVIEFAAEKCDCTEDDPRACSRSSNCINIMMNVECDKSCPAGKSCQNQKLRNREIIDIEITKTKNCGFGAFCVNDVEANAFITEYVGELINLEEQKRRMNIKISKKEKDFYFLMVEGDVFIDAEFYSNKSRFFNHSCDPNCETRKITVDGITRIGIFSNKFIPAGTELTFNYKMEFVDNIKMPCFCGSKNCSGFIGDEKKEGNQHVMKQNKRRKSKAK